MIKLDQSVTNEQNFKKIRKYNYQITHFWNIIINFEKTIKIITNKNINIEILKGANIYGLGNVFRARSKDDNIINFEVTQLIEKNYQKKISFKCRYIGFNSNIDFLLIVEIRYSTIDSNTLLYIKFNFDSVISDNEKNKFSYQVDTLLDNIREYLNFKIKYQSEQTESTIIRKSQKSVWKLFTNTELLKRVIPDLFNENTLTGKVNQIDSICKLRLSDNIDINFKVKDLRKEKKSIEWLFILECFQSTPVFMPQNIEISFLKLGEKLTYIRIKNEFKGVLSQEIIGLLANFKSKLLKRIKKKLEKNGLKI